MGCKGEGEAMDPSRSTSSGNTPPSTSAAAGLGNFASRTAQLAAKKEVDSCCCHSACEGGALLRPPSEALRRFPEEPAAASPGASAWSTLSTHGTTVRAMSSAYGIMSGTSMLHNGGWRRAMVGMSDCIELVQYLG